MGLPAHVKFEEADRYFEAAKILCELFILNTFSMKARIPFVRTLTGNYRKETKALEVLHEVTKSIITRKRQMLNGKKSRIPLEKVSILAHLLESEIHGRPLKDEEIQA